MFWFTAWTPLSWNIVPWFARRERNIFVYVNLSILWIAYTTPDVACPVLLIKWSPVQTWQERSSHWEKMLRTGKLAIASALISLQIIFTGTQHLQLLTPLLVAKHTAFWPNIERFLHMYAFVSWPSLALRLTILVSRGGTWALQLRRSIYAAVCVFFRFHLVSHISMGIQMCCSDCI